MKTPLRFAFRCSAFGFHYYNCYFSGGSIEVCHQGLVEDCPSAAPRHGWSDYSVKPEGFDESWRAYCKGKLQEYEAWKLKNAHLFQPQITP